MQKCPHCGAANSVRRTTCYQCQRPLEPAQEQRTETTAASRWEMIETQRGGPRQRPLRPAQETVSAPKPSAPAGAKRRPVSYLPRVRSSLKHVRRMGLFFHELHTITRSGIAVAPACRELAVRAPARLRGVAGEMAEAAEEGRPISSVLERHRTLFYPWHIGVVRAAEAGGFLPEAFEQIAHAYEVEWETRAALRLRLFVYLFLGVPAVLLVAPVILLLGQPIPEDGWNPGLILQALALHLRTFSLPVALAIAAAVVVWQLLGATGWFQGVQQRVVLLLPVVGRLARAAALDRYLATLGLMLRGGLPVTQAAEEAALAAGNVVLTPKLLQAVPALREGVPLSQALGGMRLLDSDTLNMAVTGEASGSLPDMLARAAGYYRQENEAKRRMLLKAAGIAIGVLWLCAAGAMFLLGLRAYFDFAFQVESWITGEDLEGVKW
jgi:type II secretory pathway component PulF